MVLVSNATVPRQNTQHFYEHFAAAAESGRAKGSCSSRRLLLIPVPKRYKENILLFDTNLLTSVEAHCFDLTLHTSITEFAEVRNLLDQGKLKNNEICITTNVFRNAK